MTRTTLALFSLGGGEIILILAVLMLMFLVPAVIVVVTLLVIGANRKTSPPVASPGQSAKSEKVVVVKCQTCSKLNDEDAKFCQECGRKF